MALDLIALLTGGAVTEEEAKDWFTNMRAALLGRHDPLGQHGTIQNLNIALSVAAGALTIAFTQRDGDDADAENTIAVGFRDPTLANFGFNMREVAAALNTVVRSGDTLGHVSGVATWVYFYALDITTSWEPAVSSKYFGDQVIVSTTALSGAAATSATTMYSTTARSNVAARYVGRWNSTQTVAGTWASTSGEKHLAPVGDLQAAAGSLTDPAVRVGDTGKTGFQAAAGIIGAIVEGIEAWRASATAMILPGSLVWGSGSANFGIVHKRKTADESVSNSNVLQNDDHLSLTLGPNEVWHARLHYFFTFGTVGSFLVGWGALPSGATGRWWSESWDNGGRVDGSIGMLLAQSNTTFPTGGVGPAAPTNTLGKCEVEFYIETAGSGGTFQIQFCQFSSNGTPTTALKGSYLTATRVS